MLCVRFRRGECAVRLSSPMRRPSQWIILFTALAGLVYLGLQRPADEPALDAHGAAEPVVVHRGGGGRAPGADACLAGRVLDRLGWPLPGAKVSLRGSAESAGADDSGAFHLPVPT